MRLLVSAGGTGGGVYPALSVVQAVGERAEAMLWVGGEGGMEAELVRREGIPFETVPAAGVHGVGLRKLPGNVLRLGRGYFAARKLVRDFCPTVMLFTGGYVAVPVALAGHRTPILLAVPDIEPGLALKTLARFADQIALVADDSRAFFPGHSSLVVTGRPARQELMAWERDRARHALDLQPDLSTLLVFGGSLGARSINRAVLAVLPQLLDEMQVVHLSGKLDWAEVDAARTALSPAHAARYRPFPYLHEEMGAAYAAADVALSRGGASAVGELPLFGLPAILVPYPHAWRYQMVNARYLARHGAAVIVEDADLPKQLLPTVQMLVRDAAQRAQMQKAMHTLARPDAAEKIVEHLYELSS